MNAKTLEAVRRHGETLLAAFPNATEQDPVALCKKLRRIEAAVSRVTTDYCNGTASLEMCDNACDTALERATKLLDGYRGFCGLFINRDPRGRALKVSSEWARKFNDGRYKASQPSLHTDMGGYGILAPDLNQ